MKREPTAAEYDAMVQAVAEGDRIQAISLYIAITECGLTQAQQFVRGLVDDAGAPNPKAAADRNRKKGLSRLFGR